MGIFPWSKETCCYRFKILPKINKVQPEPESGFSTTHNLKKSALVVEINQTTQYIWGSQANTVHLHVELRIGIDSFAPPVSPLLKKRKISFLSVAVVFILGQKNGTAFCDRKRKSDFWNWIWLIIAQSLRTNELTGRLRQRKGRAPAPIVSRDNVTPVWWSSCHVRVRGVSGSGGS